MLNAFEDLNCPRNDFSGDPRRGSQPVHGFLTAEKRLNQGRELHGKE